MANKTRKGRKPKANDEYCAKLEEMLAKELSDYGYRLAIWTSDRLRAHLEKETGILLSESRFRVLMKKKGYRGWAYLRPIQPAACTLLSLPDGTRTLHIRLFNSLWNISDNEIIEGHRD